MQLGGLDRYPNESTACAAADALRLTINNQSKRKNLQKTTVNTLWEHYCREELPLKEISTQDAYLVYAKNWILPRWGDVLLEEIKTIEVERWLRATEIADGTKAKIKCVMSAVFSHRLGNTSRGTRGTTLAGLRLQQYELQCATFLLLASGWTPEEHKNGSIREAVADASEPEAGLAGVEVTKSLQPAGRFRLLFGTAEGKQTARSSFGVEEENPTGIQEDRHHGRGLAHFSAHGGNYAGGDGRTSAHNPRLLAAQQPSCHEQVPAGDIEDQTLGTRQIGRRDFADGSFAEDKPNPMSAACDCSRVGPFSLGAYRPLTSPDLRNARVASA